MGGVQVALSGTPILVSQFPYFRRPNRRSDEAALSEQMHVKSQIFFRILHEIIQEIPQGLGAFV